MTHPGAQVGVGRKALRVEVQAELRVVVQQQQPKNVKARPVEWSGEGELVCVSCVCVSCVCVFRVCFVCVCVCVLRVCVCDECMFRVCVCFISALCVLCVCEVSLCARACDVRVVLQAAEGVLVGHGVEAVVAVARGHVQRHQRRQQLRQAAAAGVLEKGDGLSTAGEKGESECGERRT